MIGADAALSSWLTECPGAGTKVLSSAGDLPLMPASRSIKLEPSVDRQKIVAAAYVGASCYAVAGGQNVEEATRWLAYRLGVAPEPGAVPIEEHSP